MVTKRWQRLYKVWNAMLSRCYSDSNPAFDRYGGRGIRVCKKWCNSFPDFYAWCITNGYRAGLELDRVENDKGYTRANCRFVTRRENANNRECTKFLRVNGVKLPFAIVVEKYGVVSSAVVTSRLRLGWSVKSALKTPVVKASLIDYTGQKYGLLRVVCRAKNYKWTCKCKCGTIKDIRIYDLLDGKTTSCGCSRLVRSKS